LLKAIDGIPNSDPLKYSATVALANLSSHKKFLKTAMNPQELENEFKIDDEIVFKGSKVRLLIKPLIHILDSNDEKNINLIQSTCITLCNIASKTSLHQYFIHEPEISTIKNCLLNPVDKDLTIYMIKLVCNLSKNSAILMHLS
jgi:hypothetical protein